jgi:hypothetical protein
LQTTRGRHQDMARDFSMRSDGSMLWPTPILVGVPLVLGIDSDQSLPAVMRAGAGNTEKCTYIDRMMYRKIDLLKTKRQRQGALVILDFELNFNIAKW